MSRIEHALHNEFQLLELLHDELALQSHLFKAEVKSRWETLETKRSELKEHLGRAQVAAGDAKGEIDSSVKLLIESLTTAYTEIKNTFKH